MDLRQRVWAAWRAGTGTQAEVAARFAVSESFVRDLSRRHKESGQVGARPRGGGNAARVDAAIPYPLTHKPHPGRFLLGAQTRGDKQIHTPEGRKNYEVPHALATPRFLPW